jgi:ATP-binding cassette subfamily B protein
MEKRIISREAVADVIRSYSKQYLQAPLHSLVAFTFPALGTVLVHFVPPLIVAGLITKMSSGSVTSLQEALPQVALLGGLWAVGEVLWRIGLHYIIKIEADGMEQLTKSMFQTLSKKDYDFYANNFVGSLVKKGMAYAQGFEVITDTLAANVMTNLFPLIFAVIILWGYSPWIPVILLFWIAVTTVVAIPIIRKRAHLIAIRHDASSKVTGRLSDSVTNMIAIKSFAQEGSEYASFGKQVDHYTQAYRNAHNYQNLRFEAVISPIYVITNVCGLLLAIFCTLTFGLGVGSVVVVFSYYTQITRIFWEINRVYRNIESSITGAAEFTEMNVQKPRITDAPNAQELVVNDSAIVFENVDFTYNEQDATALFLTNFNLEIKAKQKVGLVGTSGGGKTTITKLLLRFADVTEGSIKIDGQDIRSVTQESLRRSIAYVPQEPLLFHRSLAENIAYGDAHATHEDIVHAAKIAHAHEFVNELPQGYDTLVGERGIKLSGGQRQRIAIARAMLKKAPIIILDEATSSLDSESEKYIQEGLVKLMEGKTAIVVAHRLSTIKHLDRIIVLEKGTIVQDGTHNQLIKQEGLYKKLWSHQSGDVLE